MKKTKARGRATCNASDKRGMDKPKGWSHYTLLHRHGASPIPSFDPFPNLPPNNTTSPQLHPHPKLPVSYSLVLYGDRHTPGRTQASALKGLYPWANEDLIEDVLGSVEGDEKRAIEWLDSMAASFSSEDSASSSPVSSLSEKEASALNRITSASVCALNGAVSSTELPESCVIEEPVAESDDLKGALRGVPVEPEWQEDDPYFIFRKDALTAGRAAYRHAKSAAHAFKMGDHRRAQVLSTKAQEERICAQALNAKAASEIFRLKNLNRDIWSLDLHGLHASEAVIALQARLSEIELQKSDLFSSRLVRHSLLNRYPQNGSRETLYESTDPKQKCPKSLALNLSANKELTVIIGSGTHSRGGPTLPNAVESYLDTNQYRYDKPRPGIITIKPKRQVYER